MKLFRLFALLSLLTLFFVTNIFAQSNGSVSGQVLDSLGGVVIGANVIAVDANAKEKSVITNRQGEFVINGLAPGKYTVRVIAPKFNIYESDAIEIVAGQKVDLKELALTVEDVTATLDVNNDTQATTDADGNKDQNILTGKDLDNLPDDPDELAAALMAMAGGGAGPDGAQLIIDGVAGGRMPPKDAIREIRFNRNPFSAEFERFGFGRVEILTKPGSDKFRGGSNFNFNDESLNARNPFSLNRAASQLKSFGANISGPIQKGKSSFFLDMNYRTNTNGSVVNATVLDSGFNVIPFTQEFTVPSRSFSISPRVDYQFGSSNTLVARYSFSNNSSENQGINGFSLPSRASDSSGYQHEVRLTETAILNAKTVNETRFQYEYNNRTQTGDNSIPTIQVSSAFTGGGAQVGENYTKTKRWELQNFTTTSLGKNGNHSVKFGGGVRAVNIADRSEFNYGGAFTFTGVRDAVTGAILFTSIEQYRQKLLGNADPRFNPNQYNITTGNPVASVSQYDIGFFFTDDWKARQDLTVSYGVRYENQTNVKDSLNFAPRLTIAWQPGAGGARQPKTVIRGGAGIFYNRFGENNTLQTIRSDGVSQRQYVVTNNPVILGQPVFSLNGVTNVPTAAQLGTLVPLTSVVRTIDNDLQSPYTIQGTISVERTLPKNSNLTATYAWSRSLHILRTRNINAPICPTGQVCPINATRPFPTLGNNIYQYESTGVSDSQFLNISFNTRIGQKLNVFSNYRLGIVKGTSDGGGRFGGGGGGSFPAYTYDTSGEYGYTSFDTRHSVTVGGFVQLPYKFSLNSFVNINSAAPFNIVTGIDSNRDSQFAERPTYSELSASCASRGLTNSFCDISGIANPTTSIIPRNYGRGAGSVNVNMGLSRTFGFGKSASRQGGGGGGGGGGNRGGGGGGGGNRGGGGGGGGGQQVIVMGGGGGGGMMMGAGGDGGAKPYNLTLSINASNLLNTNNKGNPVGNMNSSLFGKTNSSGGGFFGNFGGGGSSSRRVDLSMRFSW